MRPALQQPLNPIDRAMLTVDRSLRSFGYPGFQTQTLLWLTGPVDMERLRKAVGRFARRHPLVTARLVEAPIPHWKYASEPSLPIHETEITSADDVLSHAAGRLSTRQDPAESDPLRIELLHRPDGRDALIMQYNHVLLDNNATPRLIQELDAASQDHLMPLRADLPCGNLIWRYLRRVPTHRRRAASRAAILHWRTDVQHGARMMGQPGVPAATPVGYRLHTVTLDEHQTRGLKARATAVCGLPAVSMTILASVFRALAAMPAGVGSQRDRLVAGIGVDLNLRRVAGSPFQNLMSVVPVHAHLCEVGVRDELVRILNGRLRDQLEKGIDLGVLRQTTAMSRRPRALQWAIHHFLQHTCSLWYAYFGSLDQVGRSFCGATIERIEYFGPAWPPLGITLLASTYRGRLTFGMTSVPASVPNDLAHRFLDAVLHDLVA